MVWISGGNPIHKLSWCAIKQAFSSFDSHNLEHSITCSSNFWFKRIFSRNQNFLFSMCWYQWANWVWKRVRKFISFLSATSPEPPPLLPPKKLMLGSIFGFEAFGAKTGDVFIIPDWKFCWSSFAYIWTCTYWTNCRFEWQMPIPTLPPQSQFCFIFCSHLRL